MGAVTRHLITVIASAVAISLIAGCTPRVIVRANPAANDLGIRYYRPKPYLKVEPAEVSVAKDRTTLVPGMVRISLAYLPDFSEEYAIDVRPGLGTADVGIRLEDGWNLTEVSQDLDSQTDENVKAVGSLIGAIGEVVPTSGAAAGETAFTVPARHVPIGFYESVVGRDARGCKRLYGFRYVGFLPYASCPIAMSGHDHACCGDGIHSLYGLIFRDGQMVFEPLETMPSAAVDVIGADADPSATRSGPESPLGPNPPVADLQRLPIEMRRQLMDRGFELAEVRAYERNGRVMVEIMMADDVSGRSVERFAKAWLAESYPDSERFEVRVVNGAQDENSVGQGRDAL